MRSRLGLVAAIALVANVAFADSGIGGGGAASMPSRLPASTDAQGWNSFCNGMYTELVRQAVESNNQVQYDDSKNQIAELGYEFGYMTLRGTWNSDTALYWRNIGMVMAGKEIWDLNTSKENEYQNHSTIVMLRAKILDQCGSLAAASSIYKGMFEKQLRILSKGVTARGQ